jgi:hypothetical protein
VIVVVLLLLVVALLLLPLPAMLAGAGWLDMDGHGMCGVEIGSQVSCLLPSALPASSLCRQASAMDGFPCAVQT